MFCSQYERHIRNYYAPLYALYVYARRMLWRHSINAVKKKIGVFRRKTCTYASNRDRFQLIIRFYVLLVEIKKRRNENFVPKIFRFDFVEIGSFVAHQRFKFSNFINFAGFVLVNFLHCLGWNVESFTMILIKIVRRLISTIKVLTLILRIIFFCDCWYPMNLS